jgi:hypothetical protein
LISRGETEAEANTDHQIGIVVGDKEAIADVLG